MQSIILVTSIAKPAWQNRHPMQRVPIGARSTHPYLDLFEFEDKWYFFIIVEGVWYQLLYDDAMNPNLY